MSFLRTSAIGAALGNVVDAAREVGPGDPFETTDELEVLANLHVGVKRRRFGQVADAALHVHRLLQDIVAGDVRGSGRRGQEAREDPHGRRFTGAVRAEESDDLSLLYFKGNIVDSDVACVSLRQAFHLDHIERSLYVCFTRGFVTRPALRWAGP